MRHQKAGRKLGRTGSHRRAMFRNMVTSLLEHGAIRTTDQKAKELRRVADRMVTLGKRNTVHAKRQAAKTIKRRDVLVRLFDEIAPGYEERHGGYTRIVKLGRRQGDNAMMSLIELMPAGAPEKRERRRPVAPSVAPSAAVPETKERFDVEASEEESAVAAPEAEAVAEAPESAGAEDESPKAEAAETSEEEAPIAEAAQDEAPEAEAETEVGDEGGEDEDETKS